MAKVEIKQPIVDEIAGYLADAQAMVLVDYRGLTVEEDTQLRKALREAGVDYKVLEENAGHGDIRILMDTYVDAQKDFKEKELQKYVEYVKLMLGDLIYRN